MTQTVNEYRIKYDSPKTKGAFTDIFAVSEAEARKKFANSHGIEPTFKIHSVDVLKQNISTNDLSAIDKAFHS